MDLAGIWDSLNDKCWPLLDVLHLGDFFDKHNLPPILFPLAIIAIIILVLLLMSGGGGQEMSYCEDGTCNANETSESCPEDCGGVVPGTTGKSVRVIFSQVPQCLITVTLRDSSGSELATQAGVTTELNFNDIDTDNIAIIIQDSSQHSQTIPLQSISEGVNTIRVTLDSTICPSGGGNGVLRLSVKDASNNAALNNVKVTISETQGGYAVNTPWSNALVNGERDFTLQSSKTYMINAQKDGYQSVQEQVYISPTAPTSKAISLTPLPSGTPQTGELEVCAKNGTSPLTAGLISVHGAADDFMLVGEISQADPTTEPSGPGCYVFKDIPSGKMVTISMSSPPKGCIPIAVLPVTITPIQRQLVDLVLDCAQSIGYLKVKVIGANGVVLTQNATLTVWKSDGTFIPGGGVANSLAYGSNGYTEEVTVPSDTPLYVWARGLPSNYLDYKSDNIEVSKGQHRAVILNLSTRSAEPNESKEFTFSGVAAPNVLSKGQHFSVTINKILFGQTVLAGTTATVTVDIGGRKCQVLYGTIWRADCIAPSTTGSYNITITATYGKNLADYTMTTEVREYALGAGLIVITPAFATHGEPPLDLFYSITFNNSPIQSIAAQKMGVRYLDSPAAYAGNASNLEKSDDGYWTLVADVPYKGNYQLNMYVEISKDGVYYNVSYTFGFTATAHSPNLKADVSLPATIFYTREAFPIDIVLTHNQRIASRLDILKLYAGGIYYKLPWDSGSQQYSLRISAPPTETCNLQMKLLINGLEIPNVALNGEEAGNGVSVHIISLNSTKSVICPLDRQASCKSIEDVRKCTFNYKTQTAPYQEQQIVGCILSGCGESTSQECLSANKGDLVPDCQLDAADVSTAESFLSTVTSPSGRNTLAQCGDMNNDGVVDNNDLTCLQNMVAGKWYGDVGDGACSVPMNGGFCFQIDTDSSLPGDMKNDGRIDDADETVMEKIIVAVSAGVTPAQNILNVADFNEDGTITNADLTCLRAMKRIDFERGTILPSQEQIPLECMRIFNMECRTGSRGDLNSDGKVDETDFIILTLMVAGQLQVTPDMLPCADVNVDESVTKEDLMCMSQLLKGDIQHWMACIGCQENMPPAAYSPLEICNDGWDNNCDGKIDMSDPACKCGPTTPCEMKFDSDGGVNPGVDDGNYKLCRSVTWEQVLMWRWYTPNEIKCVKDHQCEKISCDSQSWTCSSESGGASGKWYPQSYTNCTRTSTVCGTYTSCHLWTCTINNRYIYTCDNDKSTCGPPPSNLPGEKCGDGWDNDCKGGDAVCDTDSCFPAGTKVTMADGSTKNIEDVKVGNLVATYDTEAGLYTKAKVLEIESPIRYHIYTLKFKGGKELRLTSEHPLYAKEKGWASIDPEETLAEDSLIVETLAVGDEILDINGNWARVNKITFENIPEGVQTYNLKRIENYNDYFADGFLAHNKGGCLYLYSVVSNKTYLDHLGYPMSILPSWESYTYGTMANLRPENGKLTVRLSEELPEITSINKIALSAVDHPPGMVVMPDAKGTVHTLSNLLKPLSCKAKDGEDCTYKVSFEDRDGYIFDLASLNGKAGSDIQDEIILEFPKPADAKEVKVILKGSESGIITFVWWKILETVGKDNLEGFLSDLGKNATVSQVFDDFVTRNAKVSAHVWDGSKWVSIDSQYLGFSNRGKRGEAIMLSQIAPGPGLLKLKLTFAVGTFSIDQVAVDYSKDAPIKVSSLQLAKAVTFDGKDALKTLLSDDGSYLVMKKGEWADAIFTDVPASPLLDRSYVAAVKGHYTYDIPVKESPMTSDKMLWITKLFTDDEFLLEYAIQNYLPNQEAFDQMYNG